MIWNQQEHENSFSLDEAPLKLFSKEFSTMMQSQTNIDDNEEDNFQQLLIQKKNVNVQQDNFSLDNSLFDLQMEDTPKQQSDKTGSLLFTFR